MNGKRRLRGGHASFFARMICLALFFLGGVFLGQVLSSRVPDGTGQELTDYLRRYVSLENAAPGCRLISALALYFRYPLLAVLLSFSPVGVVLVPAATAAFGFFLSFSVCCFSAAFGTDGILLATTCFGLRCLISLPCYFLLAVPAWEHSAALVSLGKGHRTAVVRRNRGFWLRLGLCTAVLLAGVFLELLCSPWLMRAVLDRIII